MSKREKTYTFTKSQLELYLKEKINKRLEEVREDDMNRAVNQAMILLLTLPMEVLMDHYWFTTADKRIPEFTAYLIDYYTRWQNDELDMEKMKQDLWEYGGIRLELEEK